MAKERFYICIIYHIEIAQQCKGQAFGKKSEMSSV